MILSELLKNIDDKIILGQVDIDVKDIVYDSNKISKGCMFVCLRGANFDGHDFIEEAINNGASVILCEEAPELENVTIVKTSDTRKTLAEVSAAFFKYPSEQIKTIAITGTKGKTTTACMVKSVLEQAGYRVGMIGTFGITINSLTFKTNNTTPESYEIQRALRKMVEVGCKYVVMEASSIGLKTHRLDCIEFDYGIFTNFSKDHIGGNEHSSMEEYLECKSLLFKRCKKGVINCDDQNYEKLLNDHVCETYFYGFSSSANIFATESRLTSRPGYLGVRFETSGDRVLSIDVPIPGKFSVYNALAAMSVCALIGISDQNIVDGLDQVKVKGRVESVKVPGDYTLLIDYAHNAVSMENVITTLREYNPNRIVTMFGAGGNRPKVRRYEMGEVSGRLSDLSVITEDNSRRENVNDIIADIKIGIDKTGGKYVVIPDRRNAIKYCIENAQPGDIIILAGKGHEDYQEIGTKKYHFDEREVIKSILDEQN